MIESGTRSATASSRARPVEVELLSSLPVDRLASHEGVTWLDREIVAQKDNPRDAGFGREFRSALAARRSWLIDQGLASIERNQLSCDPQMLAKLERREILSAAARITDETGLQFTEAREQSAIEGILRARVSGASAGFALIENGREFSLVPWQAGFASAVGDRVSGIIRSNALSWSIARERGREI